MRETFAEIVQIVRQTPWIDLLRLPYGIRIIIAVVLSLIGFLGIRLVFACWPSKHLNKEYFEDFVTPQTKPLQHIAWIVGYLLLPGKAPGEDLAYTLPMALISVDAGVTVWCYLICTLSIPLLIFTICKSHFYRKTAGWIVGRFPWFCLLEQLGFGMLFLCGIEAIARLIDRSGATMGSFLYFVFHAMNLLQIFIVAGKLLGGTISFGLSFFSKEDVQAMAAEMRQARSAARQESGSSGGGLTDTPSRKKKFPETLWVGGELYHLQNDSGDNATYCNRKTGETIHVHESDVPGWD